MQHGFSISSIIILILLILIIWGVRITAPKVYKSVSNIKSLSSPAKQITQYPITGCSISRIDLEAIWQ